MTSSESAARSSWKSCLSFKRFCGWLHALRSRGSASNFERMVSLSLSISAWPVLTEGLNHHRLISSHWLVSKAVSLRLSPSFDFQFFSLPERLWRGSIPSPVLVRHQGLPHLLPRRCCVTRASGHGRAPPASATSSIGYQDVLVRRSLGLGVRHVLLLLCMDLVRGSLLDQLRVQRLFTGFPALTQPCRCRSFLLNSIEGQWMPSCGSRLTPRSFSCCLERLEHLFENVEHLARLRICRPGEILSASTSATICHFHTLLHIHVLG